MQELPHDRAQLIAAASARRAALTEAGVYAGAVSFSPFLFKSPSAPQFELAATLAYVALVLRSMSGAVSAVRAEQAMLADNRDVLQRRLEKSLVQRAELAKQFGLPVLQKRLYLAEDVTMYLEYGSGLPLKKLPKYRAMLRSGALPADTFLLLAAQAGDAPMVQQLLDAGADPQHQDPQGKTALELMPMHAVRRVLTAVT
ncbi:hypothetical protein D9Q98_003663 [Chlorella vulgaris]|uniref:Ankyrin repeat domain-containing protein n=1 Tax=Chlorella vulgaris TaxID=3077 RepID=A0A9D4TTC7_CHLVU|nr:hypothetical protein D9Q98_003663 [Chlorella vulgaris]